MGLIDEGRDDNHTEDTAAERTQWDPGGGRTKDKPKPSPIAETWDQPRDRWLSDRPPNRRYLLRHPTRDGNECAPGSGDGLLACGKAATLTSAGGVGKTNLVIQMAVSVATGRPWLDHFHVSQDVPGRVLLLLGEEDAEEVHRRMYFVAEAMELDDAERQAVVDQVVALPLAGESCPLLELDSGSEKVLATHHLDALWKALREDAGEGWALVVIDPQVRFAGVEVEMSNTLATRFVQMCEALTKVPGGPAVLVIAHTSKNARRNNSADSRGVTALTDGFRWHATLTSEGDAVKFQVEKNNYGRPSDPVRLKRGLQGLLFVESDAEREERSEDDQGTADEKFDALVERAVAVVRKTGSCSSRETIAKQVRGNLFDARAAVDAAVDRGRLKCKERGRHATYTVPADT